MTAYTASSHEATKNSFSRRALIGGTAALGAVGLLSAAATAVQALKRPRLPAPVPISKTSTTSTLRT